MNPSMGSKWPKILPPLTQEEEAISNDFMSYWHQVLPKRYGLVEKFNHGYATKQNRKYFKSTLEIGAGLGEHLSYECLQDEQIASYVAVDIRQNMVEQLRDRHPEIRAIQADCQGQLDFEDGHFDRILAIHVLEHLPDLPRAVREMYRLCNKHHGFLKVVIPCEGGFLYSLARRISARRIFEKRYKMSYDWFISREHINRPDEILEELAKYFELESSSYFPLIIKSMAMNICVGATLRPRKNFLS